MYRNVLQNELVFLTLQFNQYIGIQRTGHFILLLELLSQLNKR